MLTHETPDATPVQVVQRILAVNPLGFPAQARRERVKSRGVVSFRCSLWVGGGQAVR